MKSTFPDLTLSTWLETRDTVHSYTRVLGKIRQALTPYQRHWWHVSLRVSSRGLTTTPVPAPEGTFELDLDLARHEATFVASTGDRDALSLTGQPATELFDWMVERAGRLGADPQLERDAFRDEAGAYDREAVGRYLQALVRIDQMMKYFSGAVRESTSPVQLFPHHFDLSVNWFSGRRVPDADPEDEESADEQMNFGFSTGSETIAEAYFYSTAYPLPDGLARTEMPPGAYWNSEGFQGAILPYAELIRAAEARADEAGDKLHTFLTTLQKAGAALMQA